ncbi:MAG: IS66 family transposase [Microbacteriaceae bacterium]
MELQDRIATMDAQQLRALAATLIEKLGTRDAELERRDRELHRRQIKIDQLTHEMAVLKRWKFAARSEQLHGAQASLLEETIDADLEAMQTELDDLQLVASTTQATKQQPKREALPASLPRVQVLHEPDSTVCHCGCQLKRIGEDVSEKLDYTPGVFQVERHVRGKWACVKCQTLIQAPVPAQVIDKGIPTAGLLAQVLVSKYADHAPLYRQEQMFARAGYAIPRSTLGAWVGVCGVRLQPLVDALKAVLLERQVLHADETPVAMLKPGHGKTHRAYLWSWCSTQYDDIKGVVYDFAETRGGRHARAFVGDWKGKLVCDDYAGYKALFETGIIEAGCMAHARRKFHDLWANHTSQIAGDALSLYGALYDVERDVAMLDASDRYRIRQARAAPAAHTLHRWLILHRQKVPDGSATARAIDYNLKRWKALTRYLDDGHLPIDNNWVENRIRPIALGRSNWLFAGSLRAGQRAAAVMSLIQSARLNGHDPYRYLKDILQRLPTQRASQIEKLLPHHWVPAEIS